MTTRRGLFGWLAGLAVAPAVKAAPRLSFARWRGTVKYRPMPLGGGLCIEIGPNGPHFRGIPIRVVDKLTQSEERVLS